MDSVCDVCLHVCARDKKCTKCQGTTHLSVCFLLLSVSDLCIYFWRIHICLAEHEYKHDSKNRPTHGSFQCYAADWHPLLSPAFLCSPAKEALMGAWRPVSGVLAKFTSHLESPEPGELRLCLPLWNSPPPGPGVPCGSPCPTNTREINQTHCWQPLTVKHEDRELHEKSGIHDRYFRGWWKKNKIWRRGFFLKGKKVAV